MEKTKRKYALRLQTTKSVRRYIASVINRVDVGELDAMKATKICYCCQVLLHALKTIEMDNLQERLEMLESKANKRDSWDDH